MYIYYVNIFTDREKIPINKDAGDNRSAQEEKTVKIKFTKKNEVRQNLWVLSTKN